MGQTGSYQLQRGMAENAFMGYSVRNERYRYTGWDEGRKVWLYDYDPDPQETNNLSGDPKQAKTIEMMKRLL